MHKEESSHVDLLTKIRAASSIADTAAGSTDPMSRLGAVVAYAGIVDLLVVHSARLIEESILKSDLSQGRQPSFLPNEDCYFFAKRLATAKLLKEIRRLISRRNLPEHHRAEVVELIRATDLFVSRAFAFIDERDFLFHRIGHPSTTLAEWLARIDKAIVAFRELLRAHAMFAVRAAPYRLTGEQQALLIAQKAATKK